VSPFWDVVWRLHDQNVWIRICNSLFSNGLTDVAHPCGRHPRWICHDELECEMPKTVGKTTGFWQKWGRRDYSWMGHTHRRRLYACDGNVYVFKIDPKQEVTNELSYIIMSNMPI